ncbi:MAG: fimbria/pilus outer membrane usher protein [bacterium]
MNDGNVIVHRLRVGFIAIQVFSVLGLISPALVLANRDVNQQNIDDSNNLQSIYEKAFGQSQQTLPSELTVSLSIGKTAIGELTAFSNQKTITHVDTQSFLAFLKKQLLDEHYQAIKHHAETTPTPQRLLLDDLKQWSIQAKYNAQRLSLELYIPDTIRLPTQVSLQRKRRIIYDDDELTQPETLSGYTNFSAKMTHDYHSGESKQRIQAKSVLNADRLVLENQVTWRNQANNHNDSHLNRDYTRLSVDDPESDHRYQLGDITTSGKNLQSSIALGGISIRKYSNMNPYHQKTQKSAGKENYNQSFSIEENSRVKIFINDRLKTVRQLDEGLYHLTDLQLSAGINTVKLEIIPLSGSGEVEEKTFTLSYNQQLLADNEAEYGLEMGLPRYRKQGRHAYDANNPIVSGYYQQGLANQTSVGVSGLSDGEHYQIGVNATKSGALGEVKAAFSLSDHEAQQDLGSKIEYRYRANKALPNLFLSGEFYGKNFSRLNYQSNENKLMAYEQQTKQRLYAQVSQQLDHQVQVNLSGQYATQYNTDEHQKSANLSLRKQFNDGKSASVNMRYQNGQYEDKSAQVQLHIPLNDDRSQQGRYKTLDTRYDSLDESIISRFTLSPKGHLGKESLATSITHQHYKTSDNISATVSYRDPRFESTVSHQVRKPNNTEDYYHRSQIKLESAVAFAGDAVGISRPIQDSFAIVTSPDYQGNTDKKRNAIAVAKGNMSFRRDKGHALPDYYHSVISEKGMPAVVPLSDYHQTQVNVDSSALPLGSDPDATEFKVRPHYHQGYQLQAGGKLGVIVDATLKDQENKVLALKGGEFIAEKPYTKNKKIKPFFTNQAGRLRLSLPVGRYKLDLYDYPDLPAIWVDVPNKQGEHYDLGIITVAIP